MKKIIKISFAVLIFTACFSFVSAQEAIYPERPRGYVSDFAEIIDNEGELELKLENYEKQTGNEISVATIQSIGDSSIEEYAVTLFTKWGIGKQDKDNGILLLVALNEKKVRIEVGYGLEGAVPDSVAGSIIRNEITPGFSQGDYSRGIEKGVDALIAAIGREYTGEEEPSDSNSGVIVFFVILAVVIVFIIIISRSSKKGGSGNSNIKPRSKSWPPRSNSGGFGGFSSGGSSSSGGGSFGGFGGGRSGGGGASGSW